MELKVDKKKKKKKCFWQRLSKENAKYNLNPSFTSNIARDIFNGFLTIKLSKQKHGWLFKQPLFSIRKIISAYLESAPEIFAFQLVYNSNFSLILVDVAFKVVFHPIPEKKFS